MSKSTRFQPGIESAERDAEIAHYWTADRTINEVAAHFGINKSTVSRARERAIAAARRPAGEEAIAAARLELDRLEQIGWAVLHANHVHISDGQVVYDNDEPVTDHRPVLMAMDRLLRIAERRARLEGYDAPTRAEVRVTDDITAEIESLAAELAGADRRTADRSEESTPGPTAG